jgi:hypothetical protein
MASSISADGDSIVDSGVVIIGGTIFSMEPIAGRQRAVRAGRIMESRQTDKHSQANSRRRSLSFSQLAAVTIMALVLALPFRAAALERTQPGTAIVTDSTAPGGRCLAVRIQEQPGATAMSFKWANPAPGLYRVSIPLRLHTVADFNPALLKVGVAFGESNNVWLTVPVSLSQLDGTPGVWTAVTAPFTLDGSPPRNLLSISWSYAFVKPTRNMRKSFETKKPKATDLEGAETKKTVDSTTDDLLGEVDADTPRPLSQINYPAILVGDPTFEPVTTTLMVEKVWPEFVHIYPHGTNPVEVTVHNFTGHPSSATVHLDMQSGLDESVPVGDQSVTVPAHGDASVKFPWFANGRDFGFGAVATVSNDGRPVHTNVEYFSVSTPIWRTAIQGSGFLTWYGHEALFPEHVASNRREYINVEEAFSWQPSSWTDLNPTNDDWWSGQGNAHNSLKGLREWMGLSHSNGIKLTTYSWATASGKRGFDQGRVHPDILCRDETGVAGGVDLDDLDLQDFTHSRPELARYQSGIWLSNFMNLGLLRTIDWHAQEVIRSSRNFGWDGMRFDWPPGWSAMGTNDVMREYAMMGVNDLMKKLVPEYYGTTNDAWSGEAISWRNYRYFRYIFAKELSENFAISYNGGGYGPLTSNQIAQFKMETPGGGQIMDEAIRNSGALSNYLSTALFHTKGVRDLGGYSCLFKAEGCLAPLASIYSTIITFAAGSHPYGDFGWSAPMPGRYTQFMTRYGEYCWDLALAPVTPEKSGVTVEATNPVVWKEFITQRQTNDLRQTVVHLIAQPEWNAAKALDQVNVPWTHNVVVKKPCHSEPTVWLLTAEPETTALRLPVEHRGDDYSVTVPTLRYWTMLLWSEKP